MAAMTEMLKAEWTKEEATQPGALIVDRSLESVLRVAAATAHVDAEDAVIVESTRPTMPVFHGEPWS